MLSLRLHLRLILPLMLLAAGPGLRAETAVHQSENFIIQVNHSDPARLHLDVRHRQEPGRSLFATTKDRAFIQVGQGEEQVVYSRASFDISDKVLRMCSQPRAKPPVEVPDGLLVRGDFADCPGLTWTFRLTEETPHQLGFAASLQGGDDWNRIHLAWASQPDELFYGFGEQYLNGNMKGRRLPVFCEEQGHGRGMEPLSSMMSVVGAGASSGSWHTTYSYVPWYITSETRGLYLENEEYLVFDLQDPAAVRAEVFSREIRGRIIHGRTPLDLISEFTRHAGRMEPLPEWVDEGIILRVYGGSEAVRASVRRAKAAGIPLAGVWLEDWMGRRQTLLGTRLWWNWESSPTDYPDYRELIAELRQQNIRVMTYFNPYLADVVEGRTQFKNRYYEQAVERGYLVRRPDGQPYHFGAGLFDGSLVDLSNPEARRWLKAIMKEQIALGISGWMADFGEALPLDARLYDESLDPRSWHNRYPAEWARLNREAMDEAGATHDMLIFHRSGSTTSPRHARAFWAGDQVVSWDDQDGLKTVIPALTSSGISGWSLNHTEIGGYLSINVLLADFRRSKELLWRWPEISVFNAVLRTHSTNRPDKNHQWDSDPETSAVIARYATIFRALAPYRRQLMAEARDKGWPLVRHPFLHYPADPVARELTQQFMFGSELMVVPVVDEGATSVQAWLPAGDWVHLISGKTYASRGGRFRVDAPAGWPTAFYPAGSRAGQDLRCELLRLGIARGTPCAT